MYELAVSVCIPMSICIICTYVYILAHFRFRTKTCHRYARDRDRATTMNNFMLITSIPVFFSFDLETKCSLQKTIAQCFVVVDREFFVDLRLIDSEFDAIKYSHAYSGSPASSTLNINDDKFIRNKIFNPEADYFT